VREAQGARIAGIICFDSDFVTFTRSIARQGADILFVPTNDWSAIAEMRAAVTRFRALETGAVLVRPTSHGVSEIVAPDGRLLGLAQYDDTRGTLLVADVPARGQATAYAAAGDWAAVGSLGLLAILIVAWRLRQSPRARAMLPELTGRSLMGTSEPGPQFRAR
jgi:apolipoprotein N-acyltransferase